MSKTESIEEKITRLEVENARLRESVSVAKAERPPRRRARGAFAAILIILGILLSPAAVVVNWVKGEVTDTDRFVATLAPLADNPAVQAFLVDEIVTVVDDQLDIDGLTADVFEGIDSLGLPSEAASALDLLQGPAAEGIRSLIRTAAERVVTSEAFSDTWENTLRISHTQIIGALEGDPDVAISISASGEVGIQLGPIIETVKQQLLEQGVTFASSIPDIDRTIVVAQSDALVQARTAYAVLDNLGFVLPVLSLLLLIGGVALANRRHRAAIWSGLGLAAMMGVIAGGLEIGRVLFVTVLTPKFLPTATSTAVYDIVTPFIGNTVLVVAVVAIGVAVAAYLGGPFRGGIAVRRATVALATSAREGAEKNSITTGSFGAWVFRMRRILRWAIALIAAAVIVFARPLSLGLIIWTAVLAVIALLLIEFLQRPQPVVAAAVAVEDTDGGVPGEPVVVVPAQDVPTEAPAAESAHAETAPAAAAPVETAPAEVSAPVGDAEFDAATVVDAPAAAGEAAPATTTPSATTPAPKTPTRKTPARKTPAAKAPAPKTPAAKTATETSAAKKPAAPAKNGTTTRKPKP